jgi:hypothetical protein
MVNRNLTNVYPHLATLYRLVLTLPVTSASCERSFSTLKLVKNHLRTVMTQDRLSDLMVIAVESDRAKKTDLSCATTHFWNKFASRR